MAWTNGHSLRGSDIWMQTQLLTGQSLIAQLKSINVHITNNAKWHPALKKMARGIDTWPSAKSCAGILDKTKLQITTSHHSKKRHRWWESLLTGIVLQRQSVWNVCGQWWRGHDASPRSIQEPTPAFAPCCTWSWPSRMPSRSHYSDYPLWQKLKVPAKETWLSTYRNIKDIY